MFLIFNFIKHAIFTHSLYSGCVIVSVKFYENSLDWYMQSTNWFLYWDLNMTQYYSYASCFHGTCMKWRPKPNSLGYCVSNFNSDKVILDCTTTVEVSVRAEKKFNDLRRHSYTILSKKPIPKLHRDFKSANVWGKKCFNPFI